MDPETTAGPTLRLVSRTCTLSRVPDQWTVIRIRSSGASPACRTLLVTSSETANWASLASGSGRSSLLRVPRALAAAFRVAGMLTSRRRGMFGAACRWWPTTVTSFLVVCRNGRLPSPALG
jgi:hypothetical protein